MAPRLRLNPPKCQALEQLSTAAPALPPTTQPPLGFTPLPSFSSISQAGSATLHPPSSTTRSRRDAVLAPPTTAPAASAVLPTASNVSSAQAPSQTLPPPLFPVSSFPTVTSGAKFSAPPAPFAPAGPPPPVSQPTFSAPPPLFPLPSFPATESGSTVPAPAVTFPPASSLLWGPHPSISASATTSTPANYSTPVPFRAIPPLPTRFSPSDFPPPTPTQATAAWYNGLSSLLNLEKTNSSVWFTLVGLYFQDSGRTPAEVALVGNRARELSKGWRQDYYGLDKRDSDPSISDSGWRLTSNDQLVVDIGQQIAVDGFKRQVFEEAIREWASKAQNDAVVSELLEKAFWTKSNFNATEEFAVVDKILQMEEGGERDQLVQRARQEAPRVFAACLEDNLMCGVRKITKQREPQCHGETAYKIYQRRKRGSLEFEELHNTDPPPPRKVQAMEGAFGRPTQVHGVPLEERAFDSKGNRLPWGLEWHEDHPNARGQRRHAEEKGPFGKSNRRKGSSRTRTATPAKKENPTLDGFEKALSFTLSQNAQSQQAAPNSHVPAESNLAGQTAMSFNKHPTQVIIFGYSSESQWAALDFYEKASYGMICEDYARDPPAATKRYPTTFSTPRSVKRSLSKAEKSMVFKYDGGEAWVKVTFDSAEAAERAIESSPTQIYGHWVYAQLYNGIGPEQDEPIPIKEGERGLRQPRSKPQTMGSSQAQRRNFPQDSGATLPRSFAPSAQSPVDQSHDTSPSSSTATSGTATGVEYPDLRQRHVPGSANAEQQAQPHDPRMMRHFPDIPRTVLRPASEAFLPQPTWWEKHVKWLSDMGLIPEEIIGNGIPLREDGGVDLLRASFYWRFFYWIDSTFGTDFCGLRDDD